MVEFDERHVASYLNLDPRNPIYWPIGLIRRLLDVRKSLGHSEFQYEIWRILQKRSRAQK